MSSKQIPIIILSILLIISCILNIIVDLAFIGWAIYWSWVCTIANLIIAIIFLVGICKQFQSKTYNRLLGELIFTDISRLFIFIIFLIYGWINWAKIIDILILTPLLIFAHSYQKELAVNERPLIVAPVEQAPTTAPYQVPIPVVTYQPPQTAPYQTPETAPYQNPAPAPYQAPEATPYQAPMVVPNYPPQPV